MGKWTQAAQRVRKAMDVAGARLDDAAALDAMAIYPERYISLIDGNTYSPDAYPAGWEMK